MQNSWLVSRRRAATIFAATLLLSACGSSQGEVAAPEPAPTIPSTKPAPEPEFTFECHTLGITIDQLPKRWNAYIDESGSGFKLPDAIVANGTSYGVSTYTTYLDTSKSVLSAIVVYWFPESGQVGEVTIKGNVATTAALTRQLTNTAGAMVYATTTMSFAETEVFLVDRLMVSVNDLGPGGFIIDDVEEDDRAFRFTVAGEGADWSAYGYMTCP